MNGRHGEVDWTPVRYVNKGYAQATLAGFYREAQVGLVTPLHDGMNLVAKEYVAAQNPADPGVLVLSEFAGAARELDAAVLVNPHDIDGMAQAIGRALLHAARGAPRALERDDGQAEGELGAQVVRRFRRRAGRDAKARPSCRRSRRRPPAAAALGYCPSGRPSALS